MSRKCCLGVKGFIMFGVALLMLETICYLGNQINYAEFSTLSRTVDDFYDAVMNYNTKELHNITGRNYDTEFDYAGWKSIQEERKLIYEKTCKQMNSEGYKRDLSPKNAFILKKFNIMNFMFGKAGSTYWKVEYCLQLGFIKTAEQFSHFLRINGTKYLNYIKTPPQHFTQMMNDMTTFITVRHPYTRLVSAYKDKIVFPLKREKFYSKAVKQKFGDISFSSFIRYVIEQNNSQKRRQVNGHWRPFYKSVSCHTKLDYFLKMETFADDLRGLETEIDQKLLTKTSQNQSKDELVDGKKKKTTQDYMNELSHKLRRKLYQVYEYDFLLWDYSPYDI